MVSEADLHFQSVVEAQSISSSNKYVSKWPGNKQQTDNGQPNLVHTHGRSV